MLIFAIYNSPHAIAVTCPNNVSADNKISDILEQLVKDYPGTRVIEIFVSNDNGITDVATFFDGYIYSSFDRYMRLVGRGARI